MKKYIKLLGCILVFTILLSGCNFGKENETQKNSQKTSETAPIITQEIPEDKDNHGIIIDVVPED